MTATTGTGEGRLVPTTTPGARSWVPWALLGPSLLLLGLLVISSLMILRLSFGVKGAEWTTWTFQNYVQLADSLYVHSIMLTFKLSILTTVIVTIVSYPVAMFLVRVQNGALRRLLVLAILLPMLMNLLLQSYGWLVLLAPDGLLNRGLWALGLADRPVMFLFNQQGVLLGLVQTSLPLAIFPIASALRNIPASYEEAASLLGANRITCILQIVIPLSLPGVIAGSLLVFAYNSSAFVIPFLLGGRRVSMLGVLIRDQVGPLLNWPLGSATSVLLLAITLVILAIYRMALDRRYKGAR